MFLTTTSDPNLALFCLETVKNDLQTFASKIHLDASWLMIATAVLALIVGIFGYKLIKLWMAVTAGFIGYWGGAALFTFLTEKSELIAKLPEFSGYILGGIFAVAFLYLGWRKFSYVMFTWFVVLGMAIVEKYTNNPLVFLSFFGIFIKDSLISPISMYLAGGLLLGLLATLFARVAFAALSSLAGSLFLFYFACEYFPALAENGWVNFVANRNANYVMLGTAVVFFAIQLLINKRKRRRRRA